MPEESILTDTINLLSTGEATIFYHLVLTHSIFMALQVAFSQQPLPIRSRARRLRLGLFLLLAIRIFLFLVAGFVYQGSGNPHNVIPPLDRAANTLSLLIIVWLWVFPRKSRIGDIATAATLIFTIIFGFITLASWLPISNQTDYFNRTSLDTAWEMFSIFLILLSSAFLLIRKTDNWEYGLSMLVLLGIGDIAHYIIGATLASDYAITVRLAQIAAFPMLVSLAQTVVNPVLDEDEEEEYEIPEEEPEVISQPPFIEDTKPTRVAPPRTAKPELLHVYLDLVGEEDPTKICKTLSKAISQTLLADICLILIPLEHGSNIILQCGYDLIREQSLDGASIDKQDIPSIATAMDKQRALRLPPKSKSPDLNGIAAALGLSKTGGLLAVPVNFPRSKTLATLVLLSPHSNYTWTKKDQTLLEKAVPGIAQLIQTAQGTQPKTTPPEQSVGPEFSAQEFAYMEKYQSLSTLHKETENNLSKAQEEINALKDTIQSYQSASQQAAAAPEDSAQLEAELQQAYQQIENLQSAVTAANKKISVMSVQPALSNDEAEVIASIAQELRQPLSSITGYTDLLLN
ncbi:MAG: GAF domain-containing protein, partial [Anaerolineae bacterium]|nr:GAF domain-containing protein [Anaerolineae bacterium]